MTAGSRSPGAVLAGASAAQAAISIVNFGLPAIGPALASDYALTLFELGIVLTAGLLGAGVSLVAAGIVVDRVGARRAMLAGTAVSVTGLAAAATASSKWILMVSLFVFGIGSSVVPIAGTGALFAAYGAGRRGWALGVRQTAVPLGGTIAAVTFPALYALAGIASTLFVTAAAVAVTGVWFAVIVRHEAVAPRVGMTRPFRSIWRAPGMQRLLLVAACYIVVLQALLTYIVPAVRAAGWSELTASVAYVAINVAAMLARIAWGRVADRGGGTRRVRTLVEVGLVAAAGGVLFALALHLGPLAVIPAAVLFGIGALGWNALVYVSAGEQAAPELAGRSVAVAATVVFVLSGLVTPALGAIVDAAGWDALWLTTAAIAVGGALLAARLPRTAIGER